MPRPPRYDRELSWLAFNGRVLQEAGDPTVPLNERVNFLAIFSGNLDEFFRVRVASLRALLRLKKSDRRRLDFRPARQLRPIQRTVGLQQERFGEILRRDILPGLEEHGVALRDHRSVDEAEGRWLDAYFAREVAQHLQPHLFGDRRSEAPFLENGRLYLVAELWLRDDTGVTLRDDGPALALVSIPSPPLDRFVEIPAEAYPGGERPGPRVVLFLDDVVRRGLPSVFPDYDVTEAFSVKLSRDADLYVEDEFAGDLVAKIRAGVAQRSTGVPSRFLYDPRTPYGTVTLLKRRLELDDEDIVTGGTYHNLADLWTLPRPEGADLSYPTRPALPHPELDAATSILAAVSERDRVVHLPYQAYDPLLRFLDEAADDPDVEDLWATLYRVASGSAVVEALCRAAEAGKRVTAFVEVKARFDEEQNLAMAERMAAAGVAVHYSMPAIKVHAKMVLAGRREGSGRMDYAALSTGNFNEKTARIYADHALLTADSRLTSDVREVFRFLAGEIEQPDTRHLLVAPFNLRSSLFALVDREIDHARAAEADPASDTGGRLTLKMNSLEDGEAVDKIYEAAAAGVDIDLIIRGICTLVPGRAGWSPQIRARSIVDRYLEHARIFRFHDAGADYVYLASADWMERNLRRRVEVAFPLYDAVVREEVLAMLQLQLGDNVKARLVDEEQSNRYVEPRGSLRAQVESYEYLRRRTEAAAARLAVPQVRAGAWDVEARTG